MRDYNDLNDNTLPEPEEFRAIASEVHEAIDRVRDGRVERTVLKSEGPRGYSDTERTFYNAIEGIRDGRYAGVKYNRVEPGSINSIKLAIEMAKPVAVNIEYVINSSSKVKPGCVRITITNHEPKKSFMDIIRGLLK